MPFVSSRETNLNMWPVLPGGESQDFGDETGRQAVDASLGRRPAQRPFRPAQLCFLLFLAELPAIKHLQQFHDPKSTLLNFLSPTFSSALFYLLSFIVSWQFPSKYRSSAFFPSRNLQENLLFNSTLSNHPFSLFPVLKTSKSPLRKSAFLFKSILLYPRSPLGSSSISFCHIFSKLLLHVLSF